MPSYAKHIGDAMVAIITGLPGAPTLVKLRKDNAILGRETPPAVIVTVEDEAKVGRAYEGVIYKEYRVVIGIYRVCLADVSCNLDLNPAFILECKQAFDTTSLSGAPAVWDIDLVDNPEWEYVFTGPGLRQPSVVETNIPGQSFGNQPASGNSLGSDGSGQISAPGGVQVDQTITPVLSVDSNSAGMLIGAGVVIIIVVLGGIFYYMNKKQSGNDKKED